MVPLSSVDVQIAVWSTTVDATPMPFVRTTKPTMQLNARAKPAIRTLDRVPMLFAQVDSHSLLHISTRVGPIVDSCLVENGGCPTNAICSHSSRTFEVVCTCQTGYTNTGSAASVNCTGKVPNDDHSEGIVDSPMTLSVDSCLVENGGCDANAVCTHGAKTNAVKCICKTGYTNTGSGPTVVCTGNEDLQQHGVLLSSVFLSRQLSSE